MHSFKDSEKSMVAAVIKALSEKYYILFVDAPNTDVYVTKNGELLNSPILGYKTTVKCSYRILGHVTNDMSTFVLDATSKIESELESLNKPALVFFNDGFNKVDIGQNMAFIASYAIVDVFKDKLLPVKMKPRWRHLHCTKELSKKDEEIKTLKECLKSLVDVYIANKLTRHEYIRCITPKGAYDMTWDERANNKYWQVWDKARELIK